MMLSKKEMSRRGFLTLVGKLGIGAVLGGSLLNLGSRALAAPTVSLPWVTWPGLVPGDIAEAAYKGYYGGSGYDGKGCAYAVFNAIVSKLNPGATPPSFPLPEEMTAYGRGGVAEVGHICGALNGAAAVINLVAGNTPIKSGTNTDKLHKIIKQLMRWYEQEDHPNYEPPSNIGVGNPGLDIPTIVPSSCLCHVFVTKWCNTYNKTTSSSERGECCARLAAEVAAQTVELLNLYWDKKPEDIPENYKLTDSTQRCLSCHGKGAGAMDNVKGEMECLECHKNRHCRYGHGMR